MANPEIIVLTAVDTGAIPDTTGAPATFLRELAKRDAAAATQFASKPRTPQERVEMCLALDAPGTNLAGAIAACRKMGVKDPMAALVSRYGAA